MFTSAKWQYTQSGTHLAHNEQKKERKRADTEFKAKKINLRTDKLFAEKKRHMLT